MAVMVACYHGYDEMHRTVHFKMVKMMNLMEFCLFVFIFETESCFFAQTGVEWGSQLTTTSASQVQAILLPQPPKQLG